MKKRIAVLFMLLTSLLFSSCSSDSALRGTVGALEKPYKASVRVSEGGDVYEVELELDENGTMTIKFLEPSLLCGISYGFGKDSGYLSYGGVSISLDGKAAKDKVSGGVYVWYDMLLPDDTPLTGRRVKEGDKTYTVISDGDTEYKFDKKTGLPVLITRSDTAISFTEFIQNAELPEGTG